MNDHPLKNAGIAGIARECDLSYEAVRKWALRGEVPIEHLATAVRLTGASPRLLAPALYRQLDEAETAFARYRRAA